MKHVCLISLAQWSCACARFRYTAAAEQGDSEAQAALGKCCRLGRGVALDLEAAAGWYHKAASSGHAKAQFNLGGMLCNGSIPGSEGRRDHQLGLKWLRRAAAQGHADAARHAKVIEELIAKKDGGRKGPF